MINRLTVFIILACFSFSTFSQNSLPVLHTNAKNISIKDGDEFRKDSWGISPEVKLDIYTSDRINESKTVTFYSDIDSLSFELKPYQKYDFVILLNGKDSCFTQLKSGMTYQKPWLEELKSDTIPFRLTKANNIAIEAVLNQQDTVELMFHTAASGITITTEATKKLKSLNLDNADTVNSWGGSSEAKFGLNNHLAIGTFTWDKLQIWETRHSGPGTDGKFGPNLFDNTVMEMNFDHNYLVIHTTMPEIDENYEQFPLVFGDGFMFLKGKSQIGEDVFENKFLIHSGFGGAILYDDLFVAENGLGEKLEVISESELKDSYGNIIKTKKAILPSFIIGETQFDNLPVGFFEGSIGRQKMSVMGGNLLKRFNLIIDLRYAQIYLKPSILKGVAYSDDK